MNLKIEWRKSLKRKKVVKILGGNLRYSGSQVPKEEFQDKGRVISIMYCGELKKDKTRSVHLI